MCGIVGLFLKDPRLEVELGAMMSRMVVTMSERGPDSTGFAIYGSDKPGLLKVTLRTLPKFDVSSLLSELEVLTKMPIEAVSRDTHTVLMIPAGSEAVVRAHIDKIPSATIVGSGRRMEIYKEVGRPEDVVHRFKLGTMRGTHGVAHTRMATESAVTTDGAHPFTTGPDQCLVHNGSLSNHNAMRRELISHGLAFETENDSEVAAGFMTWKIRGGDTLKQAMEASLVALDGFYTFVIGTETGFGVIRDPIACKPAVMAETEQWVAFGTEYRALVDLPGIDNAHVWEPVPAKAYFWERN
jgi:methylamine---glutamate N-methyltransferase subunit A